MTNLQQQLEETSLSGHRFILGMLPRGKKFKPLVSEYGAYQKHVFEINQSTQHEKVLQKLPKGSKILHRRLQRGVLRDYAIHTGDVSEWQDHAYQDTHAYQDSDSPFAGVHCVMDGAFGGFEVLTIGIPS